MTENTTPLDFIVPGIQVSEETAWTIPIERYFKERKEQLKDLEESLLQPVCFCVVFVVLFFLRLLFVALDS